MEDGQGCEQFSVIHISRIVQTYESVNGQSDAGEDCGSAYDPGQRSDALLQTAEPYGLGVLKDGLCRVQPN